MNPSKESLSKEEFSKESLSKKEVNEIKSGEPKIKKLNSKTIWLIAIIVLIISSIYYLEQSKAGPKFIGEVELQNTFLKQGKYHSAPELAGISGYLNSDNKEIKISDFKGKVVLIDFWTYTCINCIRTFPHLINWHEKYADKGLVIIGVHTPEFEFEKKRENVQAALEKFGIEYYVVQDNDYATWKAFKNRYWPHKFLIDSDGFVRYDHIGEGGYDETEAKIQELLKEIGEDVSGVENELEDLTPKIQTTPELYAGYKFALPRGQNIGNKGGLQPGKIIAYSLAQTLVQDTIYLSGTWQSNEDDLTLKSPGSIWLDFAAQDVNIVANGNSQMEVKVGGSYVTKQNAGSDVMFEGKRAYVQIDGPRLYNVVSGDYQEGILELVVKSPFFFNAFTFG